MARPELVDYLIASLQESGIPYVFAQAAGFHMGAPPLSKELLAYEDGLVV
jgi:hypothetical protein